MPPAAETTIAVQLHRRLATNYRTFAIVELSIALFGGTKKWLNLFGITLSAATA
jgi:hypothetical protein